MSSPLEDQVWKYVTDHRPLKLLFLAIAALGVLASVTKTLEPVWGQTVRLWNRYFVSSPSGEVREKYGCALQAGEAYWTLSRLVAYSPADGRSDSLFANASVQALRFCERVYQYTPILSEIKATAADRSVSSDEMKEFFAVATGSWNDFQAHLATKDRQALALLRLGSEFETARMGLSFLSRSDPSAFAGPLHEDLQEDTVRKLQRLYEEAQSKFPYPLPPLDLSTSTAATLLQSIVAAQKRYSEYFRSDG